MDSDGANQRRERTGHGPGIAARPFLKWAGGKGRIVGEYMPYFPTSIRAYYEPFLGSAAVFFALRPRLDPARVYLSDTNEHLVNSYEQVQWNVDAIIEILRRHKNHHDKAHYYRERDKGLNAGTAEERAARFIYLNKTCFNGLFRVNRDGRFNVPMGRYANPPICDAAVLQAASAALKGVHIACESYERVVSRMGGGDFVYFDPPYEPIGKTSNFTGYTPQSFSQRDQRQLESDVRCLWSKGAFVALSNSHANLISDLYSMPPYRRIQVHAPRAINSRATGRGRIAEFLILNYEISDTGEPRLLDAPRTGCTEASAGSA